MNVVKGSPFQAALKLHKQWGVVAFPFDPRGHLAPLGITLKEDSFSLDAFDGCIFRTGPGATIILNSNVSYDSRKAFTIAHELGHFILHDEPMFRCSFGDLNTLSEKSRESEANTFASELLMPSDVFTPKVRGTFAAIDTFIGLSQEFGTSLTSTAFKFVGSTDEPCMLVITKDGRVIRQARSKSFRFFLNSAASPSEDPLSIVPGAKWLTNARATTQLIEDNRYFSRLNTTMTLLRLADPDDSPYEEYS